MLGELEYLKSTIAFSSPSNSLLIEKRAGAMNQSGKFEFHIALDALAIKAGEQRGRGSAVEALVVIENANSQSMPHSV